MSTYSLWVAINGTTVWDANFGGDGQQWTSRISQLSITGGGGSYYTQAQPWTCSFDLDFPPAAAHTIRTVTVAVTGPLTGTLPAWATEYGGPGSGLAYRVVFHGNVVTAEANARTGPVRFNAVDEMTTLFSRRARLAAAPNTNPRAVLSAIETAHGLTISGETSFPNASTGGGYQIDAPAQKQTPNGDHIRTALVGTGINCHAEWNGPIGSPTLLWRPDWYWDDGSTINLARRTQITGPRPWLFDWEFGYNFDDFFAVVNVDGTDSTGTRRYGWARIHYGTDRLALGHRELQLAGWLDTTTQCRVAAKHLLAHVGYPVVLRPLRVTTWADVFAAGLAGWSTADNREKAGWNLACAMLGDRFDFTPISTELPSDQPGVTDDTADMLELAGAGPLGEPGNTSNYGGAYAIRSLTRTWDPSTGWQLELGLSLDTSSGYTIDTDADTGSGTY